MQHREKDKKEKEDANENAIDLTFCFEAIVVLDEALNKLNYIGNYTYSNSANVMSNSIGVEIEQNMERQRKLEKQFEDLIVEKSSKTELLEDKKIKELIDQIQKCSMALKNSTNNICKSLAENPDIPFNLKKAKDDKNLIMSKLTEIKEDLTAGSIMKFNEIIKEINLKSIKIDEKRKREMELFEQLRKLNDDLAKEETEYLKDTKNMESRLVQEKKKLAKTKMEENIFREYRKSQLDALKALKKSNFKDDEDAMFREISDKTKEKEKITALDNQVMEFLKEQTSNLAKEKLRWDNIKTEKENENNNELKSWETKKQNKETLIASHKNQIKHYDNEIDRLKDLGIKLNSTNIQTFVNPVVVKPESKGESRVNTKPDEY